MFNNTQPYKLDGLLQNIIQNFDKINEKEIEPTIQNIYESIFEEDLIIVIDDLVNYNFKEINEGKDYDTRKQHVLDYINNHKINLQEIYNWLLNNQNNSNSIYLLGYFNYNGIGINVNMQNAFELYQNAAEMKNNAAQYELAKMYMDDRIDISHNFDKAFELSNKLAKNEYPGGIILLGYCYDMGFGTEANQEKAIELYQKAANFGNNLAQYTLGLMYENGDGVAQDLNKAIYWYKKSAKQGYLSAQNKLKEILI
ncbi:hypothetical protein RclHR1_10860008 [Rhizophagus clarus]|uniref:Kinase-like domain-containing protein n=1 Tax=Rhizophagus clarus TaxID=94130 RepID=A0A2Z6QU40_9GLOM|nr:hypothetical protein RclHR1_10860008 [Rhizophagus clarus]GES91086.1 kinase-like domain-containing protein [Rhizophagus clarus]